MPLAPAPPAKYYVKLENSNTVVHFNPPATLDGLIGVIANPDPSGNGYYPVYVSDCVDQPQFIQATIKGRFPIYRSDEILTVWQSARGKIASQSAVPKRLP